MPDNGTSDEHEPSEDGSVEEDQRQGKTPLAHDEVYCRSCGSMIKEEAEICPECGVRQKETKGGGESTPQKNPGLAAVASFFFAGLGQIYNGQIGKGIALIIIQVINVILMFVVIGFFTYFIVWVFGIYDAYKVAERINAGEIQG